MYGFFNMGSAEKNGLNGFSIGVIAASFVLVLGGCQTTATKERLALESSEYPEAQQKKRQLKGDFYDFDSIYATGSGKRVEVGFVKLDNRVFDFTVEKFPKRDVNLSGWLNNKDKTFGSERTTSSNFGPMPYVNMTADGNECVYFRKEFGQHNRDDRGRRTKKVLGYLCKTDGSSVAESEITNLLNNLKLVKETKTGESAEAATPVAASKDSGGSSPSEELRPIAVRWEGYENLMAGTVSIRAGQNEGTLEIRLPERTGEKCTGHYKHETRTTGIWSVSCTNGLAASGKFDTHGPSAGSSGTGVDTKGRKVTYTRALHKSVWCDSFD